MIDVVIVEDSQVTLEFLMQILSRDPIIRVVGVAKTGEDAIEMVKRYHPQVVTMDIELPKMNGIEATKAIMQAWPTRIIIVTSFESKNLDLTFKAMSAGAVSIVAKPKGFGNSESEKMIKELITTIKLMSEVPVVKQRIVNTPNKNNTILPLKNSIKLIAIGASTGGPPVLQTILSGLAKNFPAPILIVQHISEGFVQGLADWLTVSTGFPVHIAENGIIPMAGNVYLAPDNDHLIVSKNGGLELNKDAPDHNLRPSIDHLFKSVAKVFSQEAIGMLLTGMGRDGADGLKSMYDSGAITIAQDEMSSLIFGMPNEAIKTGGVSFILPPNKISETLMNMISNVEENI